ncbi:hypothetical protein Hypma_014398 [Hypsizygus marmoreus]|uniref:Uncharacterized protein n=1 Tax=Hypsizygus marmoreus TaxID=39966 RepID=A0A369JB31_HYPMA|nr:hypothetical protein Hypma_014398 [Hypsizygus marmoreus]
MQASSLTLEAITLHRVHRHTGAYEQTHRAYSLPSSVLPSQVANPALFTASMFDFSTIPNLRCVAFYYPHTTSTAGAFMEHCTVALANFHSFISGNSSAARIRNIQVRLRAGFPLFDREEWLSILDFLGTTVIWTAIDQSLDMPRRSATRGSPFHLDVVLEIESRRSTGELYTAAPVWTSLVRTQMPFALAKGTVECRIIRV